MRHTQLPANKILVSISACATLFSVLAAFPYQKGYAVNSPTGGNEALTSDSFRLTFSLSSPRRFASRYLPEKRILEVRVSPARAAEFDTTAYYDTRYVHRVLVLENAGEVTLQIQLRNMNIGWLVTHQTDPWRLVLDFWRTQEEMPRSLNAEWNWQDDAMTNQVSAEPAAGTKRRETTMPEEFSPTTTQPLSPEVGESESLPPADLGRIEPVDTAAPQLISKLREQMAAAVGTPEEFTKTAVLATTLYHAGNHSAAISLFRRLAALSQTQFVNDPEHLWHTGESAFLIGKYETAKDHFRTLKQRFPSHLLSSQAELRLNDIEWITIRKTSSEANESKLARIMKNYSDTALSNKSSERAKIAASLRVLSGIIDTTPDAAKLYQQNMDTCVNKPLVPFELRKNCFYISIRSRIDSLEINDADAAVVAFQKFSNDDSRGEKLEEMLARRVETFLKETQERRSWQPWLDFEKNARPKLLDGTRTRTDLLIARAQAWEAGGDAKNAAKLFSLAWSAEKDSPLKDEASAAAARVLRKSGRAAEAEKHLRTLEKSNSRQRNGLSRAAVAIVRDLALPPYRNPRAIVLLSEEIKSGRHSERDIEALIGLAEAQRTTALGESLFEKIRAFPLARPEEGRAVEKSLLGFAQDLMRRGKYLKAGETFTAVASMTQGERRAEAAYNAGLAYSRAGQLEKARTSWQLAAGDVSDKKYSTLASERLDRLR